MNINPLSVVVATLLCAASLTKLADPPKKHSGITVEKVTPSSQPATNSAYSATYDDVADTADGNIQATGSNAAQLAHPEVQGAAERSTDDVNALRKSSE
ncbi:hypothetical protein ACI2KS_11415 [Pseudomonas sp. NPDC087358]|uniref:hypothetical protein n=1 Tax=Pseudomonas sp. NPDC087358 TaxID=3364439 RepID=UPI00384C4243